MEVFLLLRLSRHPVQRLVVVVVDVEVGLHVLVPVGVVSAHAAETQRHEDGEEDYEGDPEEPEEVRDDEDGQEESPPGVADPGQEFVR